MITTSTTRKQLAQMLTGDIYRRGLPFNALSVIDGPQGPQAHVYLDDLNELRRWSVHYGSRSVRQDHDGSFWWFSEFRLAGCSVHVSTEHWPVAS